MAETKVEQEKNYDILRSPSGDLLIVIRARMDSEAAPTIMYDGGEQALLHRNENNAVILDINPAIRSNLSSASNVLIVEAQGKSIIREYFSTVKQTKKLAIPA